MISSLSKHSAHKNKVIPDDDDDLTILWPAKREKMEVSNRANNTSFIRIEQMVKHDVWDIRKKDDGAFVLKKLQENDTGACDNSQPGVNAGSRVNPEHLPTNSGARPKVTVHVPNKNNVIINPGNSPNRAISVNSATFLPKKVITMRTSPQPKEVITMETTTAPRKDVITINTASAPKKNVITITAAPLPKKEVITINTAPIRKKEVITISTANAVKPEVITLNAASASKKKGASLNQIIDNLTFAKLGEQINHDIWNIQKEGKKSQNSDKSSAEDNSGSATQCISPVTVYTDEAYQVQEMFPEIPINVIFADITSTRSIEATVENILEGKLVTPVLSSVPPLAHNNDDEVSSQQATKTEKKVPDAKKSGPLIKIELLAKNEVWDIQKKDKAGFVMKKVLPGDDSLSQSCKPDNDTPCADSTQAMEEESEELATDDYFVDDMLYKTDPEQLNVPVKLMVYSQSAVSKSKAVVTSDEEQVEASMEIDSFDKDYVCSEEKILLDSFDFSDDENEEGETIEHFLFKASLILKKLKYLNESGNQMLDDDSALLNITGSMKTEEETTDETIDGDMVEEDCSEDDYYTDEGD